jgi:hypothetical protein
MRERASHLVVEPTDAETGLESSDSPKSGTGEYLNRNGGKILI